jgi:predicted O-methyltransferase YrrM
MAPEYSGTGAELGAVAQSVDARRILEIGTGDGSATLSMASALPADGMLITMEADPSAAAAARLTFAAAGHADRISVIVGDPLRFLHKVRGPFDLIVHRTGDLDRVRARLMALLRSGGVLISANPKYSGEGQRSAVRSILVKDMTIAEWLAAAKADADKRGLQALVPMLDGLAQATERLRKADWNDDPSTSPSAAAAAADSAQDGPLDDDH